MSHVFITQPGLYDLLPEAYHADPVYGGSLSNSGAKKILEAPALFDYWRTHPEPVKKSWDFGNAAHKRVLGVGQELAAFPKVDGRTTQGKAVKVQMDAARAAGILPVLDTEMAVIDAMADVLRSHRVHGVPIGDSLLNPDEGIPEQTLIWRDPETGVWERALIDWLRTKLTSSGRLILVDYKTAVSAATDDFSRTVVNYGYHQQAAKYITGAKAIGLADDVLFIFLVQEKTPPYLVNVVELHINALKGGIGLNRRAIDSYKECSERGIWPGYTETVEIALLPGWVENQYENEGFLR